MYIIVIRHTVYQTLNTVYFNVFVCVAQYSHN